MSLSVRFASFSFAARTQDFSLQVFIFDGLRQLRGFGRCFRFVLRHGHVCRCILFGCVRHGRSHVRRVVSRALLLHLRIDGCVCVCCDATWCDTSRRHRTPLHQTLPPHASPSIPSPLAIDILPKISIRLPLSQTHTFFLHVEEEPWMSLHHQLDFQPRFTRVSPTPRVALHLPLLLLWNLVYASRPILNTLHTHPFQTHCPLLFFSLERITRYHRIPCECAHAFLVQTHRSLCLLVSAAPFLSDDGYLWRAPSLSWPAFPHTSSRSFLPSDIHTTS